MSRQRILIVTSSPLCRNPRVLKEATTLGQAGYDVTVLTIAGREHDETIDRALLKNAPFKKMALPYFGFHGAFGLGAHAGRTFTSLARKLVPLGIERRSALGAFHRLFRVARRTPADLTIVHTELGLAIGSELLKKGRKVAADFEDWHSQDLLPAARRHRPLRLLGKVEQAMLCKASYTSTTSQAMAGALLAAHGGTKPIVITNSFPLQPPPARKPGRIPSLLWFSQTIGPGRGLEAFVQSWANTKVASHLCLLGEVSDNYKNRLLSLTNDLAKSTLDFLPTCPPDALPAYISQHDVGLALEEKSPPNKDLTISNKILQYLNVGLAVAATHTAGHREVLQGNPQAGIFIDPADPVTCAKVLDDLLSSHEKLSTMQAAARGLAEQTYCWEREEPKLLAIVQQSLARRPA